MKSVLLLVAFRESFHDDEAEIRTDGSEAIRIQGLTTKLLTSLAAEAPIPLTPGEHHLSVLLPRKGIQASMTLEVPPEPDSLIVEVWLRDNELSLLVPGPSAGYL